MSTERGAFVVSIDLPPIRAIGPTGGLSEIMRVIAGLGISATWYSPDPAGSPDIERVLSLAPAQEVGISGDATWATAGVGRNLFLRELSRRAVRAENAGYPIEALAVPERATVEHLDLALKHGIRSVRTSPTPIAESLLTRSLSRVFGGGASATDAPRPGRYGVWNIPVSQRIPLVDRFSMSGSARAAIRGAHQSLERGYYHLVVDLAIAGDARGALAKNFEKILLAAKSEALPILSVRQFLRRATQERQRVPAQSFLRQAA